MRVSSTNIWECQMSSFSLFDADEAAQAEPARQARIASNRLAAAIDDVRAGYGKFLLGATGLDEFEDRWHYSKKDIRSTVEPHLMPVTGVMRRVHDALRKEFRTRQAADAYSYRGRHFNSPEELVEHMISRGELSPGARGMHIDDVINQHAEANALDPGSDEIPRRVGRRAGLQDAPDQNLQQTFSPSDGTLIPDGNFPGYLDDVDQGGPEKVQRDFTPGGDSGSDKHARRLTASDQCVDDEGHVFPDGAYNCPKCGIDWDEAGTPEELHRWRDIGSAGLADALGDHDYREARRLVADLYTDWARGNGLRVASLDTLELYSPNVTPAGFQTLYSAICRKLAEAPGDDEGDGDDSEVKVYVEDDDEDDDSRDEDDEEGDDREEDRDSDSDDDDDDPDDDGDDEDDEGRDAPPWVAEAARRYYAEGPEDVIQPMFGPGGDMSNLANEGGGGNLTVPPGQGMFGSGGGMYEEGTNIPASALPPPGSPTGTIIDSPVGDMAAESFGGGSGTGTFSDMAKGETAGGKTSRRRYAEEQQEQQSGGGEQQQAPQGPPQQQQGPDPSQMGADPAQMMQGPPPGGNGEGAPAPDHLLDVAGQAVSQAIEQQTQQYQQIVAPLSQAIQAIQFAQQVEQAAHPLDVTPPQGTVDVGPQSAAPQPQQQMMQARRHQSTYNGYADQDAFHDALSEMAPQYIEDRRRGLEKNPRGHDHEGCDHAYGICNAPDRFEARRRQARGVNCPECGKYLRDSIARSGHAHGPNGEVYDADPQYGFESRGEYMSRGKDGLPPYSRQGRRRQAIFQTWPSEEAYQRHLEDERYAEEDRNAPPVAPPRFSDEDVAYLKSLGQTPDQAGGGFPDWESYHRYHDFRQARQQQAARRSAAWPNNNDDDLYDENGDYIGTPWPEDLKHHLLSDGSPHAAYDAGYDASWHPDFQDSGDPWGDAGEAWYNAGGKGPGFDDGWVDAASDIPHRYNDPEGYAAYRAEMDAPRQASRRRRRTRASRGRPPFDSARRTAGGSTWAPMPVEDTFSFPKAKTPVADDSIAVNDLPKVKPPKAAPKKSRRQTAGGVMDAWDSWSGKRSELGQSRGLGDDVDTFVTEKQVGPRATEILKTTLGLPTQKAGSRRQGNFFTRKVPGWRWDQFQNGYIASAPNTFTCRCGSRFDVPSYYNCRCGTVWNAFVVGQGGDHRTAQVDQYICREIQPGVGIIMANKNMEADISSVDGDMGTHSRTRGVRGFQPRTGAEFRSDSPAPARTTYLAGANDESEYRRSDGQLSGVSHRQARSKPYPDGPYVDGASVLRSGAGSRGATPEQRFARQSAGEFGVRDPARQYAGHGQGRTAMAAEEDGMSRWAFAEAAESYAKPVAARTSSMPGMREGAQLDEEPSGCGFPNRSGSVLSGDHGYRLACGPNCDCEGCGEEREEKERKQSRRRQADWRIYDDIDPEETGRPPVSTEAKPTPSDWARRDEKSRWVPPTFAPRPIR